MATGKYNVFDNLIEGVQIINNQFRYVYVNEALIKQSKVSKDGLLGHTMTELYPGVEKTQLYEIIGDCQARPSSHQIVNEFTFPDGSTGYFQLRIQSVDEGVLIFSYDITDQKIAEELIKRTNIELEVIIRQRTSELVEKTKVIESQIQRLEELNQTKDRFFSIIAHDLKSPLNSLKSFATLLINNVDKLDKEEIVKVSRQFEESIDNTIKLADNLIAWAILQMGTNETKFEALPVREIVSGTFDLFKESARKKFIGLSFSVEENLQVTGDKNQIEFIIRNLLGNALKFTNKNGSVTLTAKSISDREVLVCISDNGVGMSDGAIHEIFSIQKKISTRGTSGEKGTGLGLMLCYEFLKLNHGQMSVESEIGKGTTFSIVLSKG